MVYIKIYQHFKGEIPMKVVTHNTTQVKNIQTYISTTLEHTLLYGNKNKYNLSG